MEHDIDLLPRLPLASAAAVTSRFLSLGIREQCIATLGETG
jgi:hypothetical protein